MNNIQIFNNPQFGEIRITADENNEPLFCLADVCKALEITNTGNVKQRLSEKGIRNMDTLTAGGVQSMTYINEPNLYRCIFQSRKPDAEKFQDWVYDSILPSIRRTGSFTASNATPKNPYITEIEAQFYIADRLSATLRLNDASKLGMYQSIAEPYGLKIPAYVPSKGVLKSASALLKENGCAMSALKFNQLLEAKGYVKTLSRPTTAGREKKFKNITEKGQPYGENAVNPKNQNETQPHWYADRFMELYETVTQEPE